MFGYSFMRARVKSVNTRFCTCISNETRFAQLYRRRKDTIKRAKWRHSAITAMMIACKFTKLAVKDGFGHVNRQLIKQQNGGGVKLSFGNEGRLRSFQLNKGVHNYVLCLISRLVLTM